MHFIFVSMLALLLLLSAHTFLVSLNGMVFNRSVVLRPIP